MLPPIQVLRNKSKKRLEFLSAITDLNSLPSNDAIWIELKQKYESVDLADPILRASLSLMNSILTQERVYFAMNRRGLKELIEKDLNIDERYRLGFKDQYYSAIIHSLIDWGIIIRLKTASRGKAGIFQVVHEGLLNYLMKRVDSKLQFTQAMEFHEGIRKITTDSIHGNQVGEPKELSKEESKKQNNFSVNYSGLHDSESSKLVVSSTQLKTLDNPEQFRIILARTNIQTVIRELRKYEIRDPAIWIKYIKTYTYESKAKLILEALNLV